MNPQDDRPRLVKQQSFSDNPHLAHPHLSASEEHVESFEGWKASLSATTLELAAGGIFIGSSFYYAEHWKDWVGSLCWHASLWTMPHYWVHRPKTPFNVAGFLATLGVLVLQPHTEICKRVPYVGAVHGSASVITTVRCLQYYLNTEDFKDWKPWRRMFFISAWGWHDFRDLKHFEEDEVKVKLAAELKRLAKWVSILLATVVFHKCWGKPDDAVREGLAKLKFYLARWFVGWWTLLAWFNVMDAFPRSLHFWADQHELRHISDDPWNAEDLKEFWRRWNIPVQDMLINGVYLPISKRTWLGAYRKQVAKFLVFFMSAAGHTYAISCGGLERRYLVAMMGFFMAQVPLIGLENLGGFKGLTWMFAAEIPFAPLFIEPCLTFVGV
ncbi:hypothetical protein BASA81_010072 [Batrachochytrium salamandrivorans]|nr:hypothetical protein BASA81_010072 [Batrachochytrium salamandrivorans]